MICNPLLGIPTMSASSNPFAAAMSNWQSMWLQGLQTMQPQAHVASQLQPSVPNPADMLQQWQSMWLQGLNAFAPQGSQAMPGALQAPKITVTTIELGDMRPYMQMASQMLQAWQPMLGQMLSGGRR